MRFRLLIPALLLLVATACGSGGDGDEASGDGSAEVATIDDADGADDTSAGGESNGASESDDGSESSEAEATEENGAEGDTDSPSSDSGNDDGGPLSADEAADVLVEYSECMRNEGIEDFPDLNLTEGQAGAVATLIDAGIDLQGDEFSEAQDECGQVLGALVDALPEPSAEERADAEAVLLDAAECLRENGYPDFPDPDLSAGLGPQAFAEGVQEAGISIADPQFLAAVALCQRELGITDLSGGTDGTSTDG